MDNKSWVVFRLSDPDLSDDIKTFLIGLACNIIKKDSRRAEFDKKEELNCRGTISKTDRSDRFSFEAIVRYREKSIYVRFSLPREVANFCPRVDSMWTNFTPSQSACARNAALS